MLRNAQRPTTHSPTDDGKSRVETVFGIIQQVLGLRQFLLRGLACVISSGNVSAGVLNIVALGLTARFKCRWKTALDISSLVPALLEVVDVQTCRPSFAEISRIHHEAHTKFLCDAVRKGSVSASLDEAIAEGSRALQFCEDNRASLKVRGGIANMTLWNGDKEAAIEQTQQVLDEAVAQGLHVFAEIARRNLGKIAEGDDELEAYQVA